jgi:hypothetical protein
MTVTDRDMVRKLAAIFQVPEELLIDVGMDPPPGYWERELARSIYRRRLSTRLRRLVYRVRGVPREATIRALRGPRPAGGPLRRLVIVANLIANVGGEGGIRTHGVLRLNGFQGLRCVAGPPVASFHVITSDLT